MSIVITHTLYPFFICLNKWKCGRKKFQSFTAVQNPSSFEKMGNIFTVVIFIQRMLGNDNSHANRLMPFVKNGATL